MSLCIEVDWNPPGPMFKYKLFNAFKIESLCGVQAKVNVEGSYIPSP